MSHEGMLHNSKNTPEITSGVLNAEHIVEGKYANIPLKTLLEQYENLKEYEMIVSRDIAGETEELKMDRIRRGRELLEEIKRELKMDPDLSGDEVLVEKEDLGKELRSMGFLSDDAQ